MGIIERTLHFHITLAHLLYVHSTECLSYIYIYFFFLTMDHWTEYLLEQYGSLSACTDISYYLIYLCSVSLYTVTHSCSDQMMLIIFIHTNWMEKCNIKKIIFGVRALLNNILKATNTLLVPEWYILSSNYIFNYFHYNM